MNQQYIYIEWLSQNSAAPDNVKDAEHGNVEHSDHGNCRWGITNAGVVLGDSVYGTYDEFVQWLPPENHPIILIIPGEKVVVNRVPYLEKEKRHFAKMLPYELEDHIIEDVDELHFAMGKMQAGETGVAYINEQWFSELHHEFESRDVSISRCFADFQRIKASENEVIIWLDGDRVMTHSDSGLGFSSNKKMASVLLQNLLSNIDNSTEKHQQFSLYVTGADGIEHEIERIFNTLAPAIELTVHYQMPPLSLEHSQAINLCSGQYAKKSSMSKEIKEFRLLGLLGIVSLVMFLLVNFFDIYLMNKENNRLRQEIETAYRAVIPRGVVNDPVRQLTRKLGQAGHSTDNSQAVYLLSGVASPIQSLGVNLSAINYNNKEKSLRLNIQADSFNIIEKLRTELNTKSIAAELLSSNAVDDKFQARLRVSLEKH